MIRTSFKVTGVAALAMLAGAVGMNCSSKDKDTTGSIALALSTGGYTVNTVSYSIHQGAPIAPDAPVSDVTGSINVTDPNATASVNHSFPRGTGNTVTMDADTVATATQPSVHCHGVSDPFVVNAGAAAMVSVTLTCPGGALTTPNQNQGSVVVTGNFVQTGDICPLLTSWVASPLQTSGPGGVIDVSASATDANASDVLTYLWTAAPGGSFGSPTSTTTTYSCPAVTPGTSVTETLTFTVNDGAGCTAAISIPVTCVGVAVSTGTGGVGGSAPPVAGSGGSAPPVAGSGGSAPPVAGSGGSAPPVAGSGGSAPPVAGSGGSAPPVGGSGGSGSGFLDLSACENAGAASGYYCFGITGRTADNSADLPASGCAGFAAGSADRTACEELVTCLRGQACQAQIATALTTFPADYSFNTDPLPCLCGTGVNKSTCLSSSSWAGTCQAKFVAAAGGASNLLGRYTDTRYPIGVGTNLMTCDVQVMCFPPGGVGP